MERTLIASAPVDLDRTHAALYFTDSEDRDLRLN